MSKTFEGRSVTPKTESTKLFAKSNHQFLFMHHPSMWDLVEFEDGWEVLPMLTKFELIAGLNGVKFRPGGGIDATAARAAFMDQGWTFIDVKKGGGYLVEFDGVSGPIYVARWTIPRKLGGGSRARVLWDTDKDGYNHFRRSLMEDGTIDPPDPAALDFKIELLNKRITRKGKSAHIPQVQEELAVSKKKKKALEDVKASKKTSTRKRKPTAKKAQATK